jgi:hypothetical protein
MQASFAVLESTHRLLEGEHRQPSMRPSAWHRFAIPAPDADPRRYSDDDGCSWSARLAGESGECKRATEALAELVAE